MATLEDRFSPTGNSFGLLRLVLATGVLVAHAWPIGFGRPSFGNSFSSGQTDLGSLSLQGLFVISGFLVAGSAVRHTVGQYLWRRFLRVFPGLWACLLITAGVIAPLVAIYEHGSLRGFWSHPDGPASYVSTNWFASMQQFPISGLLAHTPYGRVAGGPSAFDGSLWSLRYEFGCYAVLAVLVATTALRRAPRVVLFLAGAGYLVILRDLVAASTWTIRPAPLGAIGPFPLVGAFAVNWVCNLGFLFLLGAAARLYAGRIPVHGGLAWAAVVLMAVTIWKGAFVAVGLPAYAYLLLYVAIRLPPPFTRVGRVRDYSYGMYIYAFPVQQVVALVGGARYGLVAYILLSLAGTVFLAALSWHVVERPALAWKDRLPVVRRRESLGLDQAPSGAG